MNHPWLTTMDCPVSAFDPKEAKKSAVSVLGGRGVHRREFAIHGFF
jgi:hypothetical protein